MFYLWPYLSRSDPSPNTGLATELSEEAGTRFLKDLDLGVLLVDPQLIEGQLASLLDRLGGNVDPLHAQEPLLPLLAFPAGGRAAARRGDPAAGLLTRWG